LKNADLKKKIIEYAKKCGADLVGFANVERFDQYRFDESELEKFKNLRDIKYLDLYFKEMENLVPEKINIPLSIYPETKTVIGLAFRVLRGSFRGVEEGSTYYQYYTTGVETIEEVYMPSVLFKVSGFIEDAGFHAVIQKKNQTIMQEENDTNPEIVYSDIYRGIKQEAQFDFTLAAVLCGLGEIGLSGSLLTEEFGPRQRVAFILTDAEIEPDEIKEPYICDRCGKCIKACHGKAFDEGSYFIDIEDKIYETKVRDNWQCAAYYKGANMHYNPFMPPDALEGFEDREKIITGSKKLGQEEAKKVMDKLIFYPGGRHSYVPSICGRACDRACFVHLEEAGKLKNKFHNKFRKGKPWKMELL